MILTWNITPIQAPRMTRADAWKKRPIVLKYRAFRDAVQAEMKKVDLGGATWKDLDTLVVNFYIPMPPSWSKKKKETMAGAMHQQKPDLDNLIKAILDSIFRDGDDCRVAAVVARKFWIAGSGKIIITI